MRLLLLCVASAIAISGCATADLERAFGERKGMGVLTWGNGDKVAIEGTQKWGRGLNSECELHLTYTNGGSSPKKVTVTLLVLHKDSGNTFNEPIVVFPTTMPGKSAYVSQTLYGGHCNSLKIDSAKLRE